MSFRCTLLAIIQNLRILGSSVLFGGNFSLRSTAAWFCSDTVKTVTLCIHFMSQYIFAVYFICIFLGVVSYTSSFSNQKYLIYSVVTVLYDSITCISSFFFFFFFLNVKTPEYNIARRKYLFRIGFKFEYMLIRERVKDLASMFKIWKENFFSPPYLWFLFFKKYFKDLGNTIPICACIYFERQK